MRRRTDAERRAIVTDRYILGELTAREWSLEMARISRGRAVREWLGNIAAAVSIVALAWAFLVLLGSVAGKA